MIGSLTIAGATRAGALELQVELTVGPGETLAVLGPNGAGKSTLLRTIAGLHTLDAGLVSVGDRVLDAPDEGIVVPPEERSVGLVFQDLMLFPHLDVCANVAFGLRARGMGRATARQEATRWLERVGLAGRGGSRPGELSGGEAQRVALARALATEPAVLLLDEPLSSLDADVRATVRRDLRAHLDQHPGPSIVVTHDPLEAAVLADRVVVMEDGRITAEGTMTELVARPRTRWGAELAGTNLMRATATGAHLLLEGGGELLAAERSPSPSALVAIRPSAVALHRDRPVGSPRNVWLATVTSVEGFAERHRVRLEGQVSLVAEITAQAVEELDVRPGAELWMSVKATEVAVYPD